MNTKAELPAPTVEQVVEFLKGPRGPLHQLIDDMVKVGIAKAMTTKPKHIDLAPEIEVRSAAELLDTRLGTVLIGASGVGKSTGLLHAFEQHAHAKTPYSLGRPCLAVTHRDTEWRALGEELQSQKAEFKLCDGEFEKIDEALSGIVFLDAADPKTLPLQILRWARARASLYPVLIVDGGFVPSAALDEFLSLLPLSVTLIWSTASANYLPDGIMSRIQRIVVMQADLHNDGRSMMRLALDLGHPAVNAFGEAARSLKPYQAIAYAQAS